MGQISTQNLSTLPHVTQLKRLLQSMAMLDSILSPDWQYRYYSFNAHWNNNEMMGSMRNGGGDEFFALFNSHGAFLKGFVHDAPVAAAGIPSDLYYRDLPTAFEGCSQEPAFSTDNVTFCIWRLFDQPAWSHGQVGLPASDDPDGSANLLSVLDGAPVSYSTWARDYYECDVPLIAVAAIYEHQPLTNELVFALNPRNDLKALSRDIAEIGYPA